MGRKGQITITSLASIAKYFFKNSTGSYVASGIPNTELNPSDTSTYGFNSLLAPAAFKIQYNDIPFIELVSSVENQAIVENRLTFYGSSKNGQGPRMMELTNSELVFYGPYMLTEDTTPISEKQYFIRSGSEGNYTYTLVSNPTGNPHTSEYYERVEAAALNNNGLNIDEGSIKLGTQDNISPTPNKQGFYVDNTGQLFIGNNDQYIRFYNTDNDTIPDTLEINTENFSIDAQGNAKFGGNVTAINLITENNVPGILTTGIQYPFGYYDDSQQQWIHTHTVNVSNNEKGMYADSNGEFFVGTGDNYLALYQRQDEDYNLDIVSQHLYLGAYDRPVEIIAEGLDNQINGQQLFSINGTVDEYENYSIDASRNNQNFTPLFVDFDGQPIVLPQTGSSTEDNIVYHQVYADTNSRHTPEGVEGGEEKVFFGYEVTSYPVYWTTQDHTEDPNGYFWTSDTNYQYRADLYRIQEVEIPYFTDSLERRVYSINGLTYSGMYNFTIYPRRPQFYYSITLEETEKRYTDEDDNPYFSIDGTTNFAYVNDDHMRVSNFTTEETDYPLYLDIGLMYSEMPYLVPETGGPYYSIDCTEKTTYIDSSGHEITNISQIQGDDFTPLYKNGDGLPTTVNVGDNLDFYTDDGIVNQINKLVGIVKQQDDDEWIITGGQTTSSEQLVLSIKDEKISFKKNGEDWLFLATEDNLSDKQEGRADSVNVTQLNVLDLLNINNFCWKPLADGSLAFILGE